MSNGSDRAPRLEFIHARSNEINKLLDHSIVDILRLMREELVMDIVLVSVDAGDDVVVSHVAARADEIGIQGMTQPKIQSFCQRVLDGRLPEIMPDVAALRSTHDVPLTPIVPGAFMAAPIVLSGGVIYGTLCCLSYAASPELNERHHKRLQISARQIARLIDEAGGC